MMNKMIKRNLQLSFVFLASVTVVKRSPIRLQDSPNIARFGPKQEVKCVTGQIWDWLSSSPATMN